MRPRILMMMGGVELSTKNRTLTLIHLLDVTSLLDKIHFCKGYLEKFIPLKLVAFTTYFICFIVICDVCA